MKLSTRRRIMDYLNSHGGYARSAGLQEANVHSAQLAELVRDGSLVRLKQGLYSLPDSDSRSELFSVQQAVPGGIFCLGTALSTHGIGTWEPAEVQLAVLRDRRIKLPEFPPIRLFSFSGHRYDLGIQEIETTSGIIHVYDREKTLCDILRFRNAIGLDVAMEAIREYFHGRSRNIPKLIEYAKMLRMEGTVRRYAEALL